MDGIKIQKTTALLMASLLAVLIFGVYTVMSASAQGTGREVRVKEPIAPDGPGGAAEAGTPDADAPSTDVQDIYIHAENDGTYDKQEVTVSAGSPVRLHFSADPDAGCGRMIVLYGLGVKAISKDGQESVVDFTPQTAGTYEYNCGMRMWQPGKLVVV
ncbi:MAG: cupredoxin domain-containing protein [Candidatus Micrarchaeota archaeon]